MSIPHLKYPFRLGLTGADVVEQDTLDEIAQSVQIIVSTNKGDRIEVPEFGIPDQVFKQESSANAAVIRAQVEQWEPRARAVLATSPDAFDELVRNIRIDVGALGQAGIPAETAEIALPADSSGRTWDSATETWDQATYTWDNS